jgi:hypothetical protein
MAYVHIITTSLCLNLIFLCNEEKERINAYLMQLTFKMAFVNVKIIKWRRKRALKNVQALLS